MRMYNHMCMWACTMKYSCRARDKQQLRNPWDSTTFVKFPDIAAYLCFVKQMAPAKCSSSTSHGELEDLIHNFLIIMLEHSMRQKDGWKVAI